MTDTSVKLCGFTLKNPIIPASGTFGYGYEMAEWYDLNVLGALVMKGTTREERFGNPTPRIAESEAGILNAIGLQNPGVHRVISEEVPKLRAVYDGPIIANASGFSVEEYIYVTHAFDQCDDVAWIEVNISCPNVQHGGMAFGTDAKLAGEVIRAVRHAVKRPIFAKLSPNVTNIAEIAKACEAEGADGIVAINNLLGMRIDPRTGRPIVSTATCGFSGPAVKPVALRMVYEIAAAVEIPVVGVGGIATANDVLEFISAGATAVEVGAQNLVDPAACRNIIETLPVAMETYGIESIESIRGRARV